MNLAEAMTQLEHMGTETNRRIYRNHGAQEQVFGVSTANLKILVKAIKKDHALAVQLWETGNYDAQVLATMIADPRQMTEETIDAWSKVITNYGITDYFVGLVIQTPFAEQKAQEWKDSGNEWIGRMGWHLIGRLASDKTRPDSEFEAYLPVIESEIHARLNRTREAMHNALIAIGTRGGAIMDKTFDSAKRIGQIDIDHGKTGCVTPDTIPYIQKAVARNEKKAVKTPVASS